MWQYITYLVLIVIGMCIVVIWKYIKHLEEINALLSLTLDTAYREKHKVNTDDKN
jgi:hypothetical protein